MKEALSIESKLVSKQLARLMPPLKNSKAEERATSCLLAAFRVIPNFAQSVLKAAGAPSGKRFRAKCYTEVVFDGEEYSDSRIDGLIVATNGTTTWTALVESKIGSNSLDTEQIERYLSIAKKHKINALITISNQYAPNPTLLPYHVSKAKLKSVPTYHLSWFSILSKAVITANDRETDDPEQSFILDDLINYFQHANSGISSFTSMSRDWKEICQAILDNKPIHKNSPNSIMAVDSWLQLIRSASIDLSQKVSKPVEVYLTSSQKKQPELLTSDSLTELSEKNTLSGSFDVPYTAGRITLTADLRRRNITASMPITAPKDVSRTTASINWLTRQFKGKSTEGIDVRAHWPGRTAMTMEPLAELLKKPELLIPTGIKDLPNNFELVISKDLTSKFKGSEKFVTEANSLLICFYSDVGQHLSAWTPKAPKLKNIQRELEIEKTSSTYAPEENVSAALTETSETSEVT